MVLCEKAAIVIIAASSGPGVASVNRRRLSEGLPDFL